MSAEKQITFRASIPQMMSAIKTGGDGLRLTLDVPESDVLAAAALITLRNCALKITVEYDSNPHATKEIPKANGKPINLKIAEPKGEFGFYWNALYKLGLFSNRDFHTALENELEMEITDYEQATRAFFGVTSRTFISPEQFEAWLSVHHLDNLVLMSGQAVRQAAAKVRG